MPLLPHSYMYTDCHSSSLHTTGDPLCQSAPLHSLNQFHCDDRFTESIQGFLKAGSKQQSYIIEANKMTDRHFEWFITINMEEVLSIESINQEWRTFTNKIRRFYPQGLSIFWVREITPTDTRRIHYHILVHSGFSSDESHVRRIFKKCLCEFSNNHMQVERVREPFHIVGYLLKQKPEHRHKILLFKPGLGLQKFGMLGPFWAGMKKREIEKRVNGREAQIAEGASLSGRPEFIRYLSEYLQLPIKQIRRRIGEDPHHPAWLEWMENLPADPSLKRALDEADAELRKTMEKRRDTVRDDADNAEGVEPAHPCEMRYSRGKTAEDDSVLKNRTTFLGAVPYPPFCPRLFQGHLRRDFAKSLFQKLFSKNLWACFLFLPPARLRPSRDQPARLLHLVGLIRGSSCLPESINKFNHLF